MQQRQLPDSPAAVAQHWASNAGVWKPSIGVSERSRISRRQRACVIGRRARLGMGTTLKQIYLTRLASLSAACALNVLTLNSSVAQQSTPGGSPGAQPLPAVIVNQPESRRSATTAPKRAARASRSAAASRKPPPERSAVFVENPRGVVRGYAAGRSMAGAAETVGCGIELGADKARRRPGSQRRRPDRLTGRPRADLSDEFGVSGRITASHGDDDQHPQPVEARPEVCEEPE